MFGFFKAKSKPQVASIGQSNTLDSLFPEKDGSEISAASKIELGKIPYYPQLIQELEHDHQALDMLEQGIRRAFLRKDLAQTSRRLKKFASLLRGHILKENVRLYVYLQQQFTNDEFNLDIIKYFRREMNGIARASLQFLEQYEWIDQLPAEELTTFLADLESIGKVVHARMLREEQDLYPLYLQVAEPA